MSTTPTPEIIEGPAPPPPPTPLDPPRVYFSITYRVPPVVVYTQEEADALDPKQWTTIPPQPPKSGEKPPAWPQLWYNINVPQQVVSEADSKLLGPDWQEFPLPDELLKAQAL